jgi:hypothetical protein
VNYYEIMVEALVIATKPFSGIKFSRGKGEEFEVRQE